MAAPPIYSGSYVGTGAAGTFIASLPFTPCALFIKRADSGVNAAITTVIEVGGVVHAKVTGSNAWDGQGYSLAISGGTVSVSGGTPGHSSVNNTGSTYYYTAFGRDSATCDTFSYSGDGTDNRSVGALAFTPNVLFLIQSSSQRGAYWSTDRNSADSTGPLSSGAAYAANHIQALQAGGFQAGSAENVGGTTYYALGIKSYSGVVATATYNGNGVDNRNVAHGLGAVPVLTIVQSRGGTARDAVFRFSAQVGDLSVACTQAEAADQIQSVDVTNAQMGTSVTVNDATGTPAYTLVTFAQSVPIASNVVVMHGGGNLVGSPSNIHLLDGFTNGDSQSGNRNHRFGVPGTLRNLRAVLGTAPGGSGTRTLTVNVAGVNSALALTYSGSTTDLEDTANTVHVNAGDQVVMLDTATGSPASATGGARWTIEFVPDVYGDSTIPICIDGGSGGTGTDYFVPLFGGGRSSTVMADVECVWPVNATFKSLYWSQNVNFGNWTYTLMVDGVASALTANGTLNAGGIAAVAVTAGQKVCVKIRGNSGVSESFNGGGIGYNTADGSWVTGVSILASQPISNSGVTYNAVNVAPTQAAWQSVATDRGAGVAVATGVLPPQVTKITVNHNAAPGSGKSYTYKVNRDGSAASDSVVLSDLNTSATATVADPLNGTTYWNIQSTPSGTPTAPTGGVIALLLIPGTASTTGTRTVTPVNANLGAIPAAPRTVTPVKVNLVGAGRTRTVTSVKANLSGSAPAHGGEYVPPPAPPTSAGNIADALAGVHSAVSLSYRYEQRDHDYILQADLTEAVLEASIDLDNDRAVIRTARFLIDASKMPESFDAANDHIAVNAALVVPYYDGGAWRFETALIPMGLYHLEAPEHIYSSGDHELWDVDASDLTSHLLTAKVPGPYRVAAGTNIITAVEAVIDLLDLRHSFDAVAAVAPVDYLWAPGTSYYQIVSDLLFAINHFPPWPDAQGVFITRERLDPEEEQAAVIYSTQAEPRMAMSPFRTSEDRSRWANRVVVVIDDPRRTPQYALLVNDDSASSISVRSLGVVNTEQPISGGRVIDLATAEEIAGYELRDRAARALPGELQTFPDPRRGPRETYLLTIGNVTELQPFRVKGWSLDLKAGSVMNHDVHRVNVLTASVVAVLAGTALDATAADIVSGGSTILLILPTGYEWVASGAAFDAVRQSILDGIRSLSDTANGFNAEVVPLLDVSQVVRSGPDLVTITLPAAASYAISLPEEVKVDLPATAIEGGYSVFVEPSFTIIP